MIEDFLQQTMNSNDIFILASYAATALVLAVMALSSWRSKKQAEHNLRALEGQLRDLSEKQK